MYILKGYGNKPDFPRFLHKSVRHRSPTLHFGPFRFWLRILRDICIKKTTPRLSDTGSRRLSHSTIGGVDNSPHHRYAESTTPRITDTECRLFNFLKEHSLDWWYGETSTSRISDAESRRLPVSLSWRFADSGYHWYGESPTPRIVESGSQRLRISVIRGVVSWKKN